MELLLILIYVSICYVVFKLFKIPVNQWSLATATLGGIIGIALLLLIMNYNHPFTTNARIYFSVTPMLPGVRGRVIEVPAQANVPLKEGDVLIRIDPKPYEYVVDQKKASLAEAEQNVKQLKSSLDQATAVADRANAQLELAQQNYDRQAELFEKKVIAQATLDTYREIWRHPSRHGSGPRPRKNGRASPIRRISRASTRRSPVCAPSWRIAEYDLAQTTTRARRQRVRHASGAAAGYVCGPTALAPGRWPSSIPDVRDQGLGAAFQQNSLQRVRTGDEAEVAFDAVPGRVFQGKVKIVLDAIAAGQIQATGTLIDYGARTEAVGRSPSSTSRKTSRATRSRLVPPRRSRSTRNIGITSRCCAKFCCACAAGKTMSS